MAREKEGLDYFPFDVHFNDAMKLIKAEFGLKGVGLYVSLLQKIYGGRGYYAPWDKDVELMFSSANGVGVSFVCEMLNAFFKRGIFSREKFEKYGILTSDGIQRRYIEAASRRISKKIDGRYLLITAPKNWDVVNICGDNVNVKTENVDSQTQRKLKYTTTTNSIVFTHARGENSKDSPQSVENSAVMPPTWTAVTLYMRDEHGLDADDAGHQAEAFLAWNARRGWTCLPDWQAAARLWVARIECPRN